MDDGLLSRLRLTRTLLLILGVVTALTYAGSSSTVGL